MCRQKKLKRFRGQNVSESELKTVLQTKPRFRTFHSPAFRVAAQTTQRLPERFVPRNVLLTDTDSVWCVRFAICVLKDLNLNFSVVAVHTAAAAERQLLLLLLSHSHPFAAASHNSQPHPAALKVHQLSAAT